VKEAAGEKLAESSIKDEGVILPLARLRFIRKGAGKYVCGKRRLPFDCTGRDV
jgi:hypothetical protein